MRWSRIATRGAHVSIALLLSPLCAGCGPGAAAGPSAETARVALDAALAAWTRGEKPGQLPGTNPLVFVHDTPWSQGLRLTAYEILGEEEDEDAVAEKRFTVRLAFSQPDRSEEVRYHVLGADPVMVFRDEDYQRNINMENGPGIAKPSSRGRGRR